MKHLLPPVGSAALCVLLLAGCATPSKVKELSLQTRYAVNHMADLHQQDLRTLAGYDRARVAQFNRLLNEYFSLRAEVVNKFNDALNSAKQASLAELDHAFDQRAEQFLAVQFWTSFRQTADKELNVYLLKNRDSAIAKMVGGDAFPSDPAQRDKAFLDARQLYLDAALKYQVVEGQFAAAIDQIDKAREDFHNANETLFASIHPIAAPPLSNDFSGFVLTNNTAQIEQRITDLRTAYAAVDDANGLLMRYLDENNPAADFFAGVGHSLGIVSGVATNIPSTTLSSSPVDPVASGLPGLSGVAAAFAAKLNEVAAAKSTGAGQLETAISKVLTIAQRPIQVVPATPSGAVTPPSNARNSP